MQLLIVLLLVTTGLADPVADQEALARAYAVRYNAGGKLVSPKDLDAKALDSLIGELLPLCRKNTSIVYKNLDPARGDVTGYQLLMGSILAQYQKAARRVDQLRVAKLGLKVAVAHLPDPDKGRLKNGYPYAFSDVEIFRSALGSLNAIPAGGYAGLVNGRWVDALGAFKRTDKGKLFINAALLNSLVGRAITSGLRFVDAETKVTYVDLRTLPKSVAQGVREKPGRGKIILLDLKKPEK